LADIDFAILTMTEVPVAQSPTTQSPMVWEDFIDVFYAPASVFRRRENGSFFIPLVVVTLLFGGMFYLNSGALRPMFDAEFDRQMAVAMRDNPNMPPEAVERMRDIGARIGQVGAFVFVPIVVCCVGIATWLVGKLFDARQSFRAAMVVAAYAYVPRVLDGVSNTVQALVVDPSRMDGRFRLTWGIGRFLDPDDTPLLLLAVVGRIDVMTIWITVLLAIGLCVTGRIPLRRAAVAAAIIWFLGALPLIFQALRSM
jgi:hypothetical protein